MRGLAALGVVVYHLEELLGHAGSPPTVATTWLANLGPAMVSVFFVLSGFLITALLLVEHGRTGTVAVGAFYARRALRIWPLYFLVVAWVLYGLPHMLATPPTSYDLSRGMLPIAAYLLLLLPNAAFPSYPAVAGAQQLWSIGVEEQFYAAWPWIVRRFGENLLPIGTALVLARAVLLAGAISLSRHPEHLRLSASAAQTCGRFALFLGTIRVAHFLAGALAARWVLRAASTPPNAGGMATLRAGALTAAVLALPAVISRGPNFPFRGALVAEPFEAALIALFLVALCRATALHSRLEHRVFTMLGRISYGIYMWHPTAMLLALAGIAPRVWSGEAPPHLRPELYAAAIPGTLALAGISYVLLERPFLRWKQRLAA